MDRILPHGSIQQGNGSVFYLFIVREIPRKTQTFHINFCVRTLQGFQESTAHAFRLLGCPIGFRVPPCGYNIAPLAPKINPIKYIFYRNMRAGLKPVIATVPAIHL